MLCLFTLNSIKSVLTLYMHARTHTHMHIYYIYIYIYIYIYLYKHIQSHPIVVYSIKGVVENVENKPIVHSLKKQMF